MRKICLYISNCEMRMKYEFKHGTISQKTGTISLKSVKEVVTRNWLNMTNESDYESDAVREVIVGNFFF